MLQNRLKAGRPVQLLNAGSAVAGTVNMDGTVTLNESVTLADVVSAPDQITQMYDSTKGPKDDKIPSGSPAASQTSRRTLKK